MKDDIVKVEDRVKAVQERVNTAHDALQGPNIRPRLALEQLDFALGDIDVALKLLARLLDLEAAALEAQAVANSHNTPLQSPAWGPWGSEGRVGN